MAVHLRLPASSQHSRNVKTVPFGAAGYSVACEQANVYPMDIRPQLRHARRLEAMGALASGIAHDFNNILCAMLGYGETALEEAPKGSRLHRDLCRIMAAGERARSLVDRILAFSRSGTGERTLVHVQDVVQEVLDLLSVNLPLEIRIDAHLNARGAAIVGDATQIHQVATNLSLNGIHAMAGGGALRVKLTSEQIDTPRELTVGTLAVGRHVLLQVTDGGTGIEPEVLARMLEPFFTTKGPGLGTGLGLAMVHDMVTELGGAMEVATTPGCGSTFGVYLPLADDIVEDAAI